MLRYVGKGNWITGVPARDLTDEEVEAFGEKWLVESGLYQSATENAAEYSGTEKNVASKRGGRLNKALGHGGAVPVPGENKD
ncbi:hypothetical protein CCP3SC1AL1_770018 [Gammaproteobacteria bacterium]